MTIEKNKQNLAIISAGDSLERTIDMNDMHNLLRILGQQLEISVTESNMDYEMIYYACLHLIEHRDKIDVSEDGDKENSNCVSSTQLLQALQFHDRATQRILHVQNTLLNLADRFKDESMSSITVDLANEITKVQSFFSSKQAQAMCDAVMLDSPIKIDISEHDTKNSPDIDFF
ncbi:MAG: hypothetical protein HRU20_21000 [Pseudomonadales bacterium]|nr:hypothetical protein [Pseudomonadales bacterium]